MSSVVRGLIAFTAIVALAFGIAWECTAAPTVQCQDGSYKTTHHNGKSTEYRCSNGEWVKCRGKECTYELH